MGDKLIGLFRARDIKKNKKPARTIKIVPTILTTKKPVIKEEKEPTKKKEPKTKKFRETLISKLGELYIKTKYAAILRHFKNNVLIYLPPSLVDYILLRTGLPMYKRVGLRTVPMNLYEKKLVISKYVPTTILINLLQEYYGDNVPPWLTQLVKVYEKIINDYKREISKKKQ